LQGRFEDEQGRETICGAFVSKVCDKIESEWRSDDTVEEKWSVVKDALCDTASSVLGYGGRRQADWYWENEAELNHCLWRGEGCT
jgi:hypothetical protein